MSAAFHVRQSINLADTKSNFMKALKLSALFLIAILFASCDANKGKVSDLVKQYVQAINEKDKVALNELYPNSKNFSNLTPADTLTIDDISVEFDEKDSVYIAKINDKQSFIVKVVGEDDLQIRDSYGVLKLDTASYDLAAKTGAPVKKMSDMANGQMFSDDGSFVTYLAELYPNAANGNLYFSNGRYNWQGGWFPSVTIEAPITNGGDKEVKGEDYNVEFVFLNGETGERVGTEVMYGLDIAGGETQVMHISKKELYYYASNRILNWQTTFKFKNASTATMLSRYGSFTGKEYDEFEKASKKDKKDSKK